MSIERWYHAIACDTSNENPLFIMCEYYTHTHARTSIASVFVFLLLKYFRLILSAHLRLLTTFHYIVCRVDEANERMSTTTVLMIVINGSIERASI